MCKIWSIGHRNIQSAALHPTTGELWEVEHGTRGGTRDLVRLELNGDKVVAEERLLKDLQPKPEAIRDVGQGPEGALYVVTDGSAGRLLKLVPQK